MEVAERVAWSFVERGRREEEAEEEVEEEEEEEEEEDVFIPTRTDRSAIGLGLAVVGLILTGGAIFKKKIETLSLIVICFCVEGGGEGGGGGGGGGRGRGERGDEGGD